MALWWIGNLMLVAVVIPVLVLLHRLMEPVSGIGREADAILAGAVTITAQLDLLGGLVSTRESVKHIRAGVAAYGVALDKIL